MHRILLAIMAAVVCATAGAQTTTILSEDFGEGKPSSCPSTVTTVTLASGDWKFNGVYVSKDQNDYRARMSGGGYFILPPLDAPMSITFNHRASGSNKTLTVEKSANGGVSWSIVGEVSPSSASAYGSASLTIGESGNDVLVRFTCGSSTIFVDNINVHSPEIRLRMAVHNQPEERIRGSSSGSDALSCVML